MNIGQRNKAALIVLLILLSSFTNGHTETDTAGAGNILYTSAPNPVGSGARALGMGGAFISIADDATAASWNPAGLVQLKRPEVSIVGSFLYRSEGFESSAHFTITEKETIDVANLNYFSIVTPFSLSNINMAISVNYQNLYDFTSECNPYNEQIYINRKMIGNLSPIGFAYSIQVTPSLQWGITLNFWSQFFGANRLKETYQMGGLYESIVKKVHEINGVNMNTGFLWHPSEKFGIGAVFKTPFSADIDAKTEIKTLMMGEWLYDVFKTNKKLIMPLSCGLGVHMRPNDFDRFSMDIYQTNWNHYYHIDENGEKYSAVTGMLQQDAHVKNTHQLRIGFEHLFVNPDRKQSCPIRIGLFYDPIPDKGSPIDAYGGNLGAGLATSHFAIDWLYQYKFSHNKSSMNQYKEYFPKDIKEHQILLSFIFYL